MLFPLFLRSLLATSFALAGAGVGAFAASGRHQDSLAPLVALAGGALLAGGLFSVLPEAARMAGTVPALLAAAAGYATLFAVGKWIYPVCPACSFGHVDTITTRASPNLSNPSLLLALVVGLHAFVDGVAVTGGTGAAMLAAVALHKLPEGMALAVLLRVEGRSPARAFLLASAIEAATLAGGASGGMILGAISPAARGLILAHLAGGFFYLVAHGFWGDLWASLGKKGGQEGLFRQCLYGAVGFVGVALLVYLSGRNGG